MSVPRAAVGLAIVAALAACGSSHRTAATVGHRTTAPPTLGSVRSFLTSHDNLVWHRLPKRGALPIDARHAEAVVLRRSRKGSAREGISATLVRATDTVYCTTVPYGQCRRIIEDRPVWIVLVPNQQVPIVYPRGKSGPLSYWATMATLVDARSGTYLEAAAVPQD